MIYRILCYGTLLVLLGQVVESQATPGDLVVAVTNPTPETSDEFSSFLLSLPGNELLTGSYRDNVQALQSGAAYRYNAQGVLQQTYYHPFNAPNSHFGNAAAVVGNNYLITSFRDDTGATDSGAAYLVQPNGSLLHTFVNPTPFEPIPPQIGELFGYSAEYANGQLLIGTPSARSGANNLITGEVAVFSSANFSDPPLVIPNPDPFVHVNPGIRDEFGYSLEFVGDKIVVGAPHARNPGFGDSDDVGAVYVFDTSGNLLRTLYSPHPIANGGFGAALVAVDDKILIGAPLENYPFAPIQSLSGAVYLFDPVDGSLDHEFFNPTPSYQQRFGFSLAVVDGNLLIGALFQDVVVDGREGGAHVFAPDGTLLFSIPNPNPVFLDRFGHAVAGIGKRFVVGARQDDAAGIDTGTFYIFAGVPEPASTTLAAWGGAVIFLARRRRRFSQCLV